MGGTDLSFLSIFSLIYSLILYQPPDFLRNPDEIAYDHYQCFSISSEALENSAITLTKANHARLLSHYFKSVDEASEWEFQLLRSAALGNAISQYEYAIKLIYSNDIHKGYIWLLLSAEQGYIDAIRYIYELSEKNDIFDIYYWRQRYATSGRLYSLNQALMDMLILGDNKYFGNYFSSYIILLYFSVQSNLSKVNYSSINIDVNDNYLTSGIIHQFYMNRINAQNILKRDSDFEKYYKCSADNPPGQSK